MSFFFDETKYGDLEDLLESMPGAVFVKNLEGRYVGCNQNFLDICQLAKEELVKKTIDDIANSKEEADSYKKQDQELLISKKMITTLWRFENKDGSQKDVSLHKHRLVNKNGEIVGIVGVIFDVDEKIVKGIEDSDILEMVLNSVSDIVFVCDKQDHKIRSIGKSIEKILGYSTQEISQKNACQLFGKKLCEGSDGEGFLTSKQGKNIPVSIKKHTLKKMDKEYFIFLAKSLESQEKISAEKMKRVVMHEQGALGIGRMASGIVHEVNTPLAAIGLALEEIRVLTTGGEIKRPELLERMLEITKNSADKISLIMKAVRLMAKSELEIKLEKIDLNNILDEALAICRDKIIKNSITINKDILQECKTMGLHGKLLVAYVNIINNAIDALLKEPNEERVILIKHEEADGDIKISFTNNGPLILKEHQILLFDPFFSTKENSTGMGLPVAKRMVMENRGEIYFDPTSDKTTFIIELPGMIQYEFENFSG